MSTKKRLIYKNENGGHYAIGVAFTEDKWMDIQSSYESILSTEDGKCSNRRLAWECKISRKNASKAITYYEAGLVPEIMKQGWSWSNVQITDGTS
jgi:hypothetical protein